MEKIDYGSTCTTGSNGGVNEYVSQLTSQIFPSGALRAFLRQSERHGATSESHMWLSYHLSVLFRFSQWWFRGKWARCDVLREMIVRSELQTADVDLRLRLESYWSSDLLYCCSMLRITEWLLTSILFFGGWFPACVSLWCAGVPTRCLHHKAGLGC